MSLVTERPRWTVSGVLLIIAIALGAWLIAGLVSMLVRSLWS